ncbi:MAG: capsular biosynthesis protein [Roseibium sp.]|uniref:hypothetical protein n=1 Tax=Roseibium sp. TaxID=1936156 RepID=UPI001B27D89D|nr:hypothetical protein [Roseibium sp.]MBO6895620.1 capsular biosynthesis protein [Roseibium sp.]
MKRLIVDIDNTLSRTREGDYATAEVIKPVRQRLVEYQQMGFTIVLHSARNMRTHEGNIGLITAQTGPVLIKWLDENSIPYDEIILGKPWCGHEGFYVDDRAIRPDEFATLSRPEIDALLAAAKDRLQALEAQAVRKEPQL